MHVLVVEDDAKVRSFLVKGLEAEGHHVEEARDGQQGWELARSGRFDLVLLDLMLPKLDGLEILRRLREGSPGLTVFVLSARGDVEDRVRGLELGADDYLPKPFSFVELRARIRAHFRRSGPLVSQRLRVGGLELERVERRARCGEGACELTSREAKLLEYFLRNPDEALTRAMITDRVWGYQFDSGTNVIDVYVNYLRKKLKALGLSPIETLRGVGYRLNSESCEP